MPEQLPGSSSTPSGEVVTLNGVTVSRGYLSPAEQTALLEDLRAVMLSAPLVQPVTPGGRQMSVRMTAAGRFGWISDRQGYRYEERHPQGTRWPPIPERVLAIWKAVAETPREPECCLVNWYGEGARMGLHQDRDETDFSCPVVSVSLGDEGLFRVGGTERSDRTTSLWLQSGDVAVLGGTARLAWHGVDRIRFGSSTLLPSGGRINLTLRVVT